MRILYIDIDSLRPDHLGCYGYHRATSPNIDGIASRGVRFENVYVSDGPCLPSRTAMFGGQFGIHTGIVGQGGAAAELRPEGSGRGFESAWGASCWMRCMRELGIYTATVSSFAERHSAWHWLAGFQEVHNPGRRGGETADEISSLAIDWLKRNAHRDDWLLHVNFWDPHTPYRTPSSFGNPFEDDPPPEWLTEEVRQEHWSRCGPHSAQEVNGYNDRPREGCPRQPSQIDSMEAVRQMFDGYDTGVRYADEHVGRLFNALADADVLESTVIIITSDHGESLGELNIYGDHQTADHSAARVPLIVRWPGLTGAWAGRSYGALHYQFDLAATMLELFGSFVPANWDAVSFADSLRKGDDFGRVWLVLSHGAWTCQRAVRFRSSRRDYLCIRTYHDGHHGFAEEMLFDVKHDPHEQFNLAVKRPDLVQEAATILDVWLVDAMRASSSDVDPLWTVIREGGPFHTRGQLPAYLDRLHATDRSTWAMLLEARHLSD